MAARWSVLLSALILARFAAPAEAIAVNFASGPSSSFELANSGGLWTIDAAGPTLRIVKPADDLAFYPQAFIMGGLHSLFRVYGDFTVTVDYDLTDFPQDPSQPATLNECLFGVRRGSRYLEVLRYVEGSSATQLIEAFGSNGAPIGSGIVPEAAMWQGRFRLSRSGDVVSGWFAAPGQNDFTLLGSLSGLTGTMELFCYAEQGLNGPPTRANSSLDVSFRNLEVDGLANESYAITTFAVFPPETVVPSIAFPPSPNAEYPAFLYAATRQNGPGGAFLPATGELHVVAADGSHTRFGSGVHDDLHLAFGTPAFGRRLFGADPSYPPSFPDGIYRIQPDGSIEPFNLLNGENSDVSSIAFTLGSSFGTYLYLASPDAGAGGYDYDYAVVRLDPSGAFAAQLLTYPDGPWRIAQGPGGAFGDYLYFGNLFSDRLCRAAPSGAVEVVRTLPHPAPDGFAFGLGGAFGRDLFISYPADQEIYRIDAAGNATIVATDLEATNLAFDPDSKDLFVAEGDRGTILRIHSPSAPETTGTWAELQPAATAPSSRDGLTAVYDPARDRMLIFGGWAGAPPYCNDTWALTFGARPSWSALTPTGPLPPARTAHAAVLDLLRNRLLLFGGYNGSRLGDVWRLSLDGNASWTQLAPTGGGPSARYGTAPVYDPVRDRLIVFGGNDGFQRNDVWALNLTGTPFWEPLSVSGSPPPVREGATAIYDTQNDRMVIFGGWNGSAFLNDSWALSLAGTPTWSDLSPAGLCPSPRWAHASVYDPREHRMLVFGGADNSRLWNDTWALATGDLAPSWSQLTPGGTPPTARSSHAAVYDPDRNRLVVCAGFDGTRRNDTWTFSFGGCISPTALSPCRAIASGLLFGPRWTTDASGIPSGSPYFFDETTVTLTKEPGDHFFLSGGIDSTSTWICGDKVYVNGVSAGLGFSGVLDPSLPLCRPIEEVLAPVAPREITDLIPDGTTCVEFKLANTNRGIYGNTAISLCKHQDPFAVISAMTDATLYQNGVDVVHMTLVTRGNGESSDNNLHLSVDLEPSLGPVMHAGDDDFGLAPGEQHVTELQWAVPDSSYPLEFQGNLRLEGTNFSSLRWIRGWFQLNPLDRAVVQAHQQQVLDCWTHEEECWARFGAMIPVAGSGFSLALATNDFCKAAQFRNAGDRGRADGAFRAGQDKLGKQLILESIEILTAGTPLYLPFYIAKVLHSTGELARNCMNGELGNLLSWLPLNGRSAASGSAVDSLATWMKAGIDSTAADLADVFLVSGQANVRIEAVGGYAVLDSTGLVYGHVDVVDTIAVIASTTHHVYELHGTENDNPHSAATFHARSLAAQTMIVGVLHANQEGLRQYLRYPEFPVQTGSHLWVNLADDLAEFPLMVDDDGDGMSDRVFSPIPAGVDDPQGTVRQTDLRETHPNPSPATTRIRFSVGEFGRVCLRIYDASGRYVTALFDRETGPGDYEVVWNGRTEHGTEAANGVYFYQLRTRSTMLARRLVLLR